MKMSSTSKVFAIALYENEAESEDELAFSKNDLLQVLECDYMGMEGWWLCKLIKSNKLGLAAGNRLKVTNDEKLIARLSNLSKLSSNKLVYGANGITTSGTGTGTASLSTTNSVNLSNSSSVSSILSSSSSSLTSGSASSTIHSSSNLTSRLQTMATIQQQQQRPEEAKSASTKINLPLKRPPLKKLPFVATTPTKSPLKQTQPQQSNPMIHEVIDNDNDDDDDYDYDIPENNRPVHTCNNKNSNAAVVKSPTSSTTSASSSSSSSKLVAVSSTAQHASDDVRKSISPTIDSGVSTSSLASLNSSSDLPNNQTTSTTSSHALTNRLSSESSNSSSSSATSSDAASSTSSSSATVSSKQQQSKRFLHTLDQIVSTTKTTRSSWSHQQQQQLHGHLHAFISNDLKLVKNAHACFHPDLAVFNRFKSVYRQLKEFYFYLDACMKSVQGEEVEDDEENKFGQRLPHLIELLVQLKDLVVDNRLLDYTAESPASSVVVLNSSDELATKIDLEEVYQYDYDNNNPTVCIGGNNGLDLVDYGDYCTIDEEDEDEKKAVDVNSATLKKSNETSACVGEQQIRREMRRRIDKDDDDIEEEESVKQIVQTTRVIRLNACDQMLIKFYLKHIEENLAELTSVRHGLVDQLSQQQSSDNNKPSHDLAHKLAITGHKLVFICDTLQRNLNSLELKQLLFDTSGSLCTALKVYMIRLKSPTQPPKNLILDSIGSVLDCATQFKSIILKYYFKSF